MKNNWLNLALAIGCILLALFLAFGCASRKVNVSKSSVDSATVKKNESTSIDTGKTGSYTRLMGWMPVSAIDGYEFKPFALGQISPVGRDDKANELTKLSNNPTSWPTELFIKYLMSLPDTSKLDGYAPFYFEHWSNEEKGLSTTTSSKEKTEVAKENKEKDSDRQSPIHWVAALVLIILGIFLIIWLVPRKPKPI